MTVPTSPEAPAPPPPFASSAAVDAAADAAGAALTVAGIEKRFGSIDVLRGVSLRVEAGTVCALLGPSGSGKTTLLRTIAGLERPDAGTVQVGERILAGDETWVAPERRRIGMVFQDWALFPQLTVADNVAFGLTRRERRTGRVAEVLAMVGLADHGDRLPGTLSGGQQQRVALARALAPRPEVLLLDEPFSNLDSTLRVQVRTDVHRLLAETGITAVFVTHDQEEAFVLGDVVAVVNDGRFEQVGTPAELYQRPLNPWVATFVGDANLLTGSLSGSTVSTVIGDVPVELVVAADGGAVAAGAGAGAGVGRPVDADGEDDTQLTDVRVLVRPEHVAVEPGGHGMVELVEYYGHDCMVLIAMPGGASIRARVVATPLQRGDAATATYVGRPSSAYIETLSESHDLSE